MITMLGWVGYPQTSGNLPMASIRKEFEGTEMPLITNSSQYPSICNKKDLIVDFARSHR